MSLHHFPLLQGSLVAGTWHLHCCGSVSASHNFSPFPSTLGEKYVETSNPNLILRSRIHYSVPGWYNTNPKGTTGTFYSCHHWKAAMLTLCHRRRTSWQHWDFHDWRFNDWLASIYTEFLGNCEGGRWICGMVQRTRSLWSRDFLEQSKDLVLRLYSWDKWAVS